MLLPLANTNKIFYLVSTLQSLALVGFLEVYWGDVEAYEFHALVYFMPFNLMTRLLKNPTLSFKQRAYFNLDNYLTTPAIL